MDKLTINHLNIYRSVYQYIDSNMYLIIEDDSALVVDPQDNAEVFHMLEKAKVKTVDILLTHEHTDHTSGIPAFLEKYNSKIICQKDCAEYIADEQNNRPLLITFILAEKDQTEGTNRLETFNAEYKLFTCQADIVFQEKVSFDWKNHNIEMFSTPGHSVGSCCILIDDMVIFTGDSLIPGLPTITRFPGGNTKNYKNITLPLLKSLDKDLIVLPGHGQQCRLADFSERFE